MQELQTDSTIWRDKNYSFLLKQTQKLWSWGKGVEKYSSFTSRLQRRPYYPSAFAWWEATAHIHLSKVVINDFNSIIINFTQVRLRKSLTSIKRAPALNVWRLIFYNHSHLFEKLRTRKEAGEGKGGGKRKREFMQFLVVTRQIQHGLLFTDACKFEFRFIIEIEFIH